MRRTAGRSPHKGDHRADLHGQDDRVARRGGTPVLPDGERPRSVRTSASDGRAETATRGAHLSDDESRSQQS